MTSYHQFLKGELVRSEIVHICLIYWYLSFPMFFFSSTAILRASQVALMVKNLSANAG